MSKSIDKLRRVFRNGLCTRCGACVGLGGGAVRMTDPEGRCLPEELIPLDDVTADRIWTACSATEVPFPELNEYVFGSRHDRHPYLGHFRRIAIGYATDPELRFGCASGGILSAVLLWLLHKGEIQGAVVTGMDSKRPWRPRSFIATEESGILAAAQSKYVITSVNEILPKIEAFRGKLAYVGLPCQVHAIRKLQAAGDPVVQNIKCVLGPFCGNTLHFSSVRSLLRSYGETDHRRIKKLSFREGEWPGSTTIELDSGRKIALPKFHANYLIPFHIMKRCLLCTDLTNEFTDLSGGDAWAPVYEERGKGFSIVLTRSKLMQRFLDRMVDEGVIELSPVDAEETVVMHSHGYDLKKHGAFIRIGFLRALGQDTPDYGYRITGFSWSRYLMELVLDFLFLILGTRLARYCLERIPPSWMGLTFQAFRTWWKRSTRNIKRADLRN